VAGEVQWPPVSTIPTTKRRTPTQARATRTRAALLEAARAEFSQRGYANTTARSIAQRAGAASGSFYQYFNDKDEVLLELVTERAARLMQLALTRFGALGSIQSMAQAADQSALVEIVDLVIELHREDPGFHAVLTEREHADPKVHAHAQRSLNAFVQLIAGLLTQLGYRGDVHARAFAMYGLVEGSVHAHVLVQPVLSDDGLRAELVAALTVLAMGPPRE
jgi:AcrR family transcriptional regulator